MESQKGYRMSFRGGCGVEQPTGVPEENTGVRREVRRDPRERRPRSPGWRVSPESGVGNGRR